MQRSSLATVAAVLLSASTAQAGGTTHTVSQTGVTFVPDTLTISAGDTVEWVWSGGTHTVTSGASCTPSGLFNQPLSNSNPKVTYTFGSVGTFDYFCIPHCGIGMDGVITVQPAIDVQEVEIHVAKERDDGVLKVNPYQLEIGVDGTGLTAVSVTDPNLASHALANTGDSWRYVTPNASSLAGIATGYGSFAFTFTGASRTETVTVTYDPGATDPHPGYGEILCPSNAQAGVVLNPTMTWTCEGGPCGNFAWYMEVFPGGGGLEYDANLPASATTWTPGPLTANETYEFWLSAGTFVNPLQVLTTSDPLDSFDYVQGYETSNEVLFDTDPSATQTAIGYCTAGTSASGCAAAISTCGLPSASAPSGFELLATGVENNKDGLFFFGANGRQAKSWGNGTSYQCVVPPVKRAGILTGVGTPGLCDGHFRQDLNALWTAVPAKNPGAGAVVQAQLWYRDPFNTSNQTTSLSDAVEFTVDP